MEASTLQPPAATLAEPRIAIGAPLLRFRSDEQLVALFRAGHEEAFRAIHDRYHRRLFAYARQMLRGRQDAEDALQDVFVRAYSGLRASDRDLALKAWLFRVAHNRCIDELRKPAPPPPEVLQLVRSSVHDPLVEVDRRESLRRLVEDIRRLPEQQRSALLMRELAGLSYAEVASSLGTTVGAIKSLLVRARLTLAQAAEARETACTVIREQLVEAHDRGIRPNANARKHMRDCSGCKSFRGELRGVSRQLAAITPATGMLGLLTKLIGFSGGGSAAGGAGGGIALLGGGGTAASTGGLALTANHVATLIVAAVATAGGAVEIQHTILRPISHPAHVRSAAATRSQPPVTVAPVNPTTAVQETVIPSAVNQAAAAAQSAATNATANTRSTGATSVARHRNRQVKPGAGAKHRSLSRSLATEKTTTTTTATATSGSCATGTATPSAAGSSTTSTGSSGTTTTTTSATSSSTTAPTSSSSSTTPTTAASCDSTTGSTTSASTGSTTSSGSGTTPGTTGTGTTSTDPTSSGTTSSPSGGGSSSGTSSGVTTG